MSRHTLHIFNPDHDIALAAHLSNFTAPLAGRELRSDMGFLPALWAAPGDPILVDDIPKAEDAYRRLDLPPTDNGMPHFIDHRQLPRLDVEVISPWGWNKALCRQLTRCGVSNTLLPSEEQIEKIRLLSHRRTAARLLPLLQTDGTVGEATECTTPEQVAQYAARYGRMVLKAPWSSSGRGVRFDGNVAWLRHIIERQGSIMVEPYYNKVKDFGMEFTATDAGIHYDGLSLFNTKNGAYTGNLLATERTKRDIISHYIPLSLLDRVRSRIVNMLDLGDYRGPFGIDMMVVESMETGKPYLLHPCVEINLRRTMGHVALSLTPAGDGEIREMLIQYDKQYRLTVL